MFLGGGALVLLMLPVFSLRLGFSDEGNLSDSTSARRAYDLVAEGFGPGFNGPFLLTIEPGSPADFAVIAALPEALAADAGVDRVGPPFPSDPTNPSGSDAFLIQIIPTTSPQDEATQETVVRLRSEVVPEALEGSTVTANLTGAVPANIDFTD